MSQPRYQIFVSSTFKDLVDERQAVLNAILKLDQFPAGMEIFPAVNDTAWEHIEKVIKDSDYYVLIIGGKYGSIETESGLSYTEKEYDFAVSQNIPVLAFTHSDEGNIPVSKSEMNAEIRDKLQNFKRKVGNKHHWNYWKTLDELKANVISSLSLAFVMNPQKGWVKAGGIEKSELLERLAETQKQNDKLKTENNKLKSSSFLDAQSNLSQGEEQIPLTIFVGSSRYKIVISWSDLFLEIGNILFNCSKATTYELSENLSPNLLDYLEELVEYPQSAQIGAETMKIIGKQFVALDLMKTGFDTKGRLYWSLSEKGKKLYAIQTSIKQRLSGNNYSK